MTDLLPEARLLTERLNQASQALKNGEHLEAIALLGQAATPEWRPVKPSLGEWADTLKAARKVAVQG